MSRLAFALAALAAFGCEHAPSSTSQPAPPVSAPAPGASVPSPTAPATAPAGAWVHVFHGALADVDVERAVYDAGEPDHFYTRVRVTNRGAAPIAIDLRGRHPGLYVNQWEVSDVDHRQVIDEERVVNNPLDGAAEADLRAASSSGTLTSIAAGAVLDLYGSFNASGRAAVDAQHGRWLLLAIDGRLAITDGTRIDDLRIGDGDDGRIVAIPAPVAWRPLPPGAHRLPD